MSHRMRYRLALDLGSTSLGWAMIRLNANNRPCAVIKVGARIFSNGRNPKDDSSLAVTRRDARSMRRRRDRLLKRKARMMRTLVEYGFFPAEEAQRKAMETMNPFALRAKGLDSALTPAEFGRALFHINQRRGFKSNRKTDKKDSDSGALKSAIHKLRTILDTENSRTVGEWLHARNVTGQPVRARFRQNRILKDDGKIRIDKSYDLYIDRSMIEHEFDRLWAKQAELNPVLFTETARADLKDVLLHQRPLKPVKPGRCTFLPEEERAPLALPSTQRFRIYQEVNHLRILRDGFKEEQLTLQQRDNLIAELEKKGRCSFIQMRKLLSIGGAVQFNFEDPKRQELKGNITGAILSKNEYFGSAWFNFDDTKQDAIVLRLIAEENETKLMRWLQEETGVDEKRAEAIANAALPEGYGSLCTRALARILPELRGGVVTYDKAVQAAGFDHHSHISPSATGEIWPELPYYGQPLQRHVGFGSNDPRDSDEKRYGRIANPTVHIGLNQVRLVVNALIKRYGHPSEVIVELARDLKQSKDQRDEENKRQADHQKRNARLRAEIATILDISEERVKSEDLQKMILWEELSFDPADRRCPYSGTQISKSMLMSDEVEVEHILPFSQTLDDSLNNKTVALRRANRIKDDRTPWNAFGAQSQAGFDYEGILARAEQMPKAKRYRFGEDGYQRWLKDDAGFLPRALNDTRYMSKVAREYLSLICPNTRVIPGRMTAMLRGKFGLNDVLGLNGEKNRNDHRHHAVDACVIGVTDQYLLQQFANASASARKQHLNRLVEKMPLPWENYREHVKRAIEHVLVSHKPDHSFEGSMFKETSYGIRRDGSIVQKKNGEGEKGRMVEYIVPITEPGQTNRHGLDINGKSRAYKGYAPDGNYCMEILKQATGGWVMEVIPTYKAYLLARDLGWGKEDSLAVLKRMRTVKLATADGTLITKLMPGDTILAHFKGKNRLLQVVKMSVQGGTTFTELNEANISGRYEARRKARLKLKNEKTEVILTAEDVLALGDQFVLSQIGIEDLRRGKARRVTISPIGELRNPGFKD
ncbi:CRISPR-associated endonuclease Csn1 [Nitrosospira sp. Nsp11]|uniref:type II CRISPR RNA-guided endonuclease Cas9 n=1 Tax=Nitrosospira sp. Nsp11 TaxID=1855338 RepID=UPI000913E70D|nr:type II CRISPR RNA-guided endonuclease Cas9 [Nitrosospira sp. Nsp11]SHL56363.1 CRISPR-associated endonuclease Csn1 [Nitrosospira sp. Nsp11]